MQRFSGGLRPPVGGQPPVWHGPGRGFARGVPFSHKGMAKYNQGHAFDAGLDALRTSGLNQEQFTNLQHGRMPGGFHGAFLGMTPAQLKQVAGFVNPQGSMQDTGAGNDPITGAPLQAMHFGYNDPRLAHGESADETAATLPWMQPQPHTNGVGLGVLNPPRGASWRFGRQQYHRPTPGRLQYGGIGAGPFGPLRPVGGQPPVGGHGFNPMPIRLPRMPGGLRAIGGPVMR